MQNVRRPYVNVRRPYENVLCPFKNARRSYENARRPYENARRPYKNVRPYENARPYENVRRPYENVRRPYKNVRRPYENLRCRLIRHLFAFNIFQGGCKYAGQVEACKPSGNAAKNNSVEETSSDMANLQVFIRMEKMSFSKAS